MTASACRHAVVVAAAAMAVPLVATSVASAAACAPGFQDAGAGICTATFAYSGAPVSVALPPTVGAVTAVVSGAEGGSSLEEQVDPFGGAPSPGGKGGRETAVIPVAAGTTLTIVVGQAGTGGVLAPPGFGGYGGGGHATSRYGGNGGGGSYVFDANGPLVVAGGGGGGGYDYNPVVRGHGDQQAPGGAGSGAMPAVDGQSVAFCCDPSFNPPPHFPAGGGGGATPAAAGVGGHPAVPPGYGYGQVDGDPGSGPALDEFNFGTGGSTHNGCCFYSGWAGGGGGGYYGGGGGGNIEADLEGGGGGGGAGYVTPAAVSSSAQAGVQVGDGEVLLSYYTGACNPSCLTCSGASATQCASCAAGYVVAGGACVPATGTTSTTTPGSTTTTTLPPADPYLCYGAQLAPGEPKMAAADELVTDVFQAKRYDAQGVVTACSPATTTIAGIVVTPAFPAVHEVSYRLRLAKTLPPQPKRVATTHVVRDGFGQLTLLVKDADTLLERAGSIDLGASLPRCSAALPCTAPAVCAGGVCVDPAFPPAPAADVGVDDFTCYKVTPAPGAAHFAPVLGGAVQVVDDVGGAVAVDVLKPRHLCAPADVASENPGAAVHPGYLLCYQVRRSAGQPKLVPHRLATATAEFPPARLVAKTTAELCVPAEKDPPVP